MCSNSSQKSGKRQQFTNCNGNGTKSIKIGNAKGEKKRQSKKQNKTKIYKKATKTLKAQAQGRRKIDIRKKTLNLLATSQTDCVIGVKQQQQ